MFKRSEESEWSRFSKAFTGKDDKTEDNIDEAPTAVEDAPAVEGTEVAAAAPMSPSARPPTAESNLTVSKPSTSTVIHPTFSADEVESTVGEHTSFDGTYRSDNSLRIRGSAQGEIECTKAVFIEESARVTAKVTAASIMVAGEVNGELNCSGRVEIRPSGRVTGTINAGSLIMQEGAFFDGTLKMTQPVTEPAFAS